MQRQCETKKRELINQESALRSKENELEIALNTANSKEVYNLLFMFLSTVLYYNLYNVIIIFCFSRYHK